MPDRAHRPVELPVRGRKDSLFYIESTSAGVAAQVAAIGRWMAAVPFRGHVQAEFMDGADPFLAAVAKVRGDVVVTLETFDAGCRKKVKLPNACHHLGVPCESTYEMLSRLGARF